MDGESEPRPGAPQGEGEPREPAAPSASPQATPPTAEAQEAVSTATENGDADEGVSEHDEEDEEEDDDVVLVGEEATRPAAATATAAAVSTATSPSKSPSPPVDSSGRIQAAAPKTPGAVVTEPIVIDDEEDSEQKECTVAPPGGPQPPDSPAGALSSTEPDSEIKIASVTTLGANSQRGGSAATLPSQPITDELQPDMNLMITSVTSLQGGAAAVMAAEESRTEENGLQISSTFSLNTDSASSSIKANTSFNPGRGTTHTSQPVHNGDTNTHTQTDSWISQSASFPRNQKQSGVDSPSPAPSLPKPQGQSSSTSSSSSGAQPQPRTVKVTCANCKKPLKKGQTAYQRKGSTHLFCSTTCLSAFSHKPAPKKNCTMCKKDITTMKGTIVAQVDSSESFQEFCSTGCLAAYESKQNQNQNQNLPKPTLKTKCTVCGKLTEIRHEVSFKTVTHKICSDACFNVYRMANGLIMNCCEHCGDYLPSRASAHHAMLVDGQQKRFCCLNCITEFKQVNSKLASCLSCKTLIRTGEVLQGLGPSGLMGSYCSATCMNKPKMAAPSVLNAEPTCHYCKRSSLPQYQATLPEGDVLNFCSYQCVTKFQNAALETATNGQTAVSTTTSSVQLKCNYCRGAFSLKPVVLEWEDKVYQFCSKTCCEDHKKLHCIVTFCENCQEEKTLHDTVNISGVKRPFCSEGCKLLFKQDFIRRLGLKCVSCNHCSQMCKRGVMRQMGGMTRDFCGDACAKKFHDWYHKAARCDCCKVQGELTESVQWRSEMKHFCDQNCLLRFYCQQNEPIMVTQKGPENTNHGIDVQGAKLGLLSQGTMVYPGVLRDVKNKAVLCKPLTLTKATYCKPHMQSKPLQTDADDGVKREFIPVPIPIPVFIPVPMSMYSQLTPTPITLPLPVPIPVFLPSSRHGVDQVVQNITELKSKVLPEPVEMNRTEANSEDHKPDVKPIRVKTECGAEESSPPSSSSSMSEEEGGEEEEDDDPELDLEEDFPLSPKDVASEPVPPQEEKETEVDSILPPALKKEKEREVDSTLPPALKKEKEREVDSTLPPPLKKEKDGEVGSTLPPALKKEKDGEVGSTLPPALKKEKDGEVGSTLPPALKKEKDGEVGSTLPPALKKEKDGEVGSTLPPALKKEKDGEVDSSLPPALKKEKDGEVDSSLPPALKKEREVDSSLPPALKKDGEVDSMLSPALMESTPQPRPRRQGHKRRAVEAGDVPTWSSSPRSADQHKGKRRIPLKARYGVNAWRRWALTPSDQSEDAKDEDGPKPAALTRSRGDLLSLSPEELCLALSQFVQEVSRPCGGRYSPDSILYLCLGIQKHLNAKGRKDDLFGDPCYQQFGAELDRILASWQPSVLPDGSLWGRVEEAALWSSRQLGGHSASALLRSLVYLNTKRLGLHTLDQHLRLSFADVYGPDATHPAAEGAAVTEGTAICIPVPSVSQERPGWRKRKREEDPDGLDEAPGSPALRCSASRRERHLYELYRAKCPTSLQESQDGFYVRPDPGGMSGSSLWFSSEPLDRNVLESLLSRVLLVREVFLVQQRPPREEEGTAAQEPMV